MALPTVEDFDNATLDLETVAQVSNVNFTADTTVNRSGDTVDTLGGRLKKLGFLPPIVYTGGIAFSSIADNIKTVVSSGVVYALLPDEIPFTTTGSFAADSSKFYVIQLGELADEKGGIHISVATTGSLFNEFYTSVDMSFDGVSSNVNENSTKFTSGSYGRTSTGIYVIAGTMASAVAADFGYYVQAIDNDHYITRGASSLSSFSWNVRMKSTGALVDGDSQCTIYGT